MSKRSFFQVLFLVFTFNSYCFAPQEKIGIVFLHGLGGSAETCKEWINFAVKQGIRPSSSQCAVYIPEASNNSWFDINPLLPDLIHISDPCNQTPENIQAILHKIKDLSPQFQSLKREIQAFIKKENIKINNLHFVGYSQGGILAQMLAYSLPSPCGSLCFAGCPWVVPEEESPLPQSIVMAFNKDDPIFGRIYPYSREVFTKKVGAKWFNTAVKEVIREEGGHEISLAAKLESAKHFRTVLGLPS